MWAIISRDQTLEEGGLHCCSFYYREARNKDGCYLARLSYHQIIAIHRAGYVEIEPPSEIPSAWSIRRIAVYQFSGVDCAHMGTRTEAARVEYGQGRYHTSLFYFILFG